MEQIYVSAIEYPKLDRLSFECLVKKIEKRLFRFIMKHVRNPDEALDLTQQTLLEAYRSFDSFRGAARPETWLFGIAMNIIRNELSRSPHRRFSFDNDDAACEEIADDHGDPLDRLTHRRLTSSIETHMDGLPDHMRTTFELVVMEGRSYDYAATQLNISIGTVRSRLSRARALLREKVVL